jgi:sugar phosphate isomerase/epimerase
MMLHDETTRQFGASSYAYSLSHTAGEAIERLAALGFPEIEVPAVPGHLWPDELSAADRRGLKMRIADAGVTVTTLTMPSMDINLTAASADVRNQTIAAIADLLDLAGDLGVLHVLITPGKSNPLLRPPREVLAGHFAAAMEQLLPRARSASTRIVVENVPACYPHDAAGLVALLDGYGAAEVGMVYDVANAHFIGEDLADGISTVGPRLDVLHFSDTTSAGWRHDEIGTGTVPFAELVETMRSMPFAGRPVLEIISPEQDATFVRSASALARLGWALREDEVILPPVI